MNIFFIGSSGIFSTLPLEYLMNTDHNICAVACDGCNSDPRFPINNDTVESLAIRDNLVKIDLKQPLKNSLIALKKTPIDLIVVSCYARRIPDEILSLACWGGVNLHPSMLPLFRGPVPIFWQLKNGENKLGVSLHRVSNKLDSGPIFEQLDVDCDDGLSHQQISEQLAQASILLIERFLKRLELYCLEGKDDLSDYLCQQDESLASSMSFPLAEDFRVSTNWSSRRIFNFMKGTEHFKMLYPCRVQGKEYQLQLAVSFSQNKADECIIYKQVEDSITSKQVEYFITSKNTIKIPCVDGLLVATIV